MSLSLIRNGQQEKEGSWHIQPGQQKSLHHVCQVIQIFKPTRKALAHSHWREVAQMCTVQQIIQSRWRHEETHAQSQRNEAAKMRRVQQAFQFSWKPEES